MNSWAVKRSSTFAKERIVKACLLLATVGLALRKKHSKSVSRCFSKAINTYRTSQTFRMKFSLAIALLASIASPAQNPSKIDLAQASLEDLMNVQVTSVSKKEQKLSKTGAAVFVITQEDIRRSGATNIPDLLRMAPGIHVAKITGETWAVSIRGFTDRFGDKVLVLIDGRSVYSPLSSGVNWDQQDVPLEDIDRIEVIRGPGGTVWGANAVNGVINIITKSAKDTQGGLASASAGSQEFVQGLLQYGGKIGQKGAYRVFGDYDNLGTALSASDVSVTDGWHKAHAGFRSDWDLSSSDSMTVQGDLLQLRGGQTANTVFTGDLPREAIIDSETNAGAGNILARWNHVLSNGSDTSLQVYYDRYNRLEAGSTETRNTIDFDFQHHLTIGSRQEIVWGGGYRSTGDHTTAGFVKIFQPDRFTDHLSSTFLQDDIRLTNSVWLTLGSKLEHNSYTRFEYEPSARLVWNLTDNQALWASASRAVRQPSRADFALNVDVAVFPTGTGFGVVEISGNPKRKAERLHDFELGYRAQITRQLSLDIVGFSSYYYNLQTQEPGQPFYELVDPLDPNAPPHLVIPSSFSDGAHAHNYGGEVLASWNVSRRWKISPGYSYLQMHVAGYSWSQDPHAGAIAFESPKHQFQIHSLWNPTRRLEFDTALYRVGRLVDGGSGSTPSYVRLDTRLGWRIGESLELSIVGQNLQSPAHAEYHHIYGLLHSLAQRAIFGRVTFRF
jgi:iron complex outermembrane receptor protein